MSGRSQRAGSRKLFGLFGKRRKPVKTNSTLRFLHEVLRLEHLHYGLWEDEERDLAGLSQAQKRFCDELVSWVPEGVRSILDVGAGIGTTSQALSRKGFEVEGLSPDPYQRDVFVQRTGLRFHLTRFQDFVPERAYDLILMSESAQYVWLDSLFPAVERVSPGGHLLLADYFVTGAMGSEDHPAAKSGHRLADFDRRAEESGLDLVRERDITEAVLPTLELLEHWIERYVEPSVDVFGGWLRGRYPRIGALAQKKALAELEKNREVASPELFRKLKRYLIRLYRVPPFS